MEEQAQLDYSSDGSDGSIETLYDGPMEWTDSNGNLNVVKKSDVVRLSASRRFNEINQYRNLVSLMRNVKKSEQLSVIFEECKSFFTSPLTAHNENILMAKLQKFRETYISKSRKYSHNWRDFQKYEKQWLESYIIVPETWFLISTSGNLKPHKSQQTRRNKNEPENIPGQRKKFSDLTIRGKQKAVQKISQKFEALPTPVILRAAGRVISKRGQKSTSLILKEIEKASDSSNVILSKIRKKENVVKKYTPDEALALFLEIGVSKKSYNLMRMQGIERGIGFYPSCNEIVKAKKFCYPENLKIEETSASVPLQDLVLHTVQRIVKLQEEPILSLIDQEPGPISSTLVGIYGFDGSSGHSRYNQNFSQDSQTKTDETLFATIFVPIRLESSTGKIIWQNPTPSSFRFCRPMKLELAKETSEKILMEKNVIESAISPLKDKEFQVPVGNTPNDISVRFDLHLTAIDGKCLQVITGVTKSSQSCPICGANPKSFNEIKNLDHSKFAPKDGTLVHGTSPLHCWIRFFEFCLKLAYRKPAGVYPVSKVYKPLFEKTKENIQVKLRDSLGILVDVVKQGAGTTNNGNMARKAFKNYQEFTTILEIDTELVRKLHIILLTMSSQLPINPEKFGKFCRDTFSHYVQLYPWNPMSATLHKILVHGENIIENSILPLGMMSEEAGESRNKFYRQDREFHARKMDRIVNLTDVFHRALEPSDPFISNYFLNSRKNSSQRSALPQDVLELLKEPAIPVECVHPAAQVCFVQSNEENPTEFEILLDNFALQVEEDVE